MPKNVFFWGGKSCKIAAAQTPYCYSLLLIELCRVRFSRKCILFVRNITEVTNGKYSAFFCAFETIFLFNLCSFCWWGRKNVFILWRRAPIIATSLFVFCWHIPWGWSSLLFLISNWIFILCAVIASLMELLAWLPIENRTAISWPMSLLWHFRCWLQNHNFLEKRLFLRENAFLKEKSKLFVQNNFKAQAESLVEAESLKAQTESLYPPWSGFAILKWKLQILTACLVYGNSGRKVEATNL